MSARGATKALSRGHPRARRTTTIADENETRDWRIYADFAHGLIRAARTLYVDEPLAVDLADMVYALDATIMDLCLSCFRGHAIDDTMPP